MVRKSTAPALAAFAVLLAFPASASVNISNRPTKNISCSAGVCTATAKNAFFNAVQLGTMLGAGDVTVNTGGGAVTIEITEPFAWSSTHRLTLNADLNVSVKAVVAVEGTSGLTVSYGNAGQGGQFQFFPGGRIDFWDTHSVLSVNGTSYQLVNDLRTLASALASNDGGVYAFAKDYDAGPDGSYKNGIASSLFQGVIEGLGHTISNLSIQGGHGRPSGMFEVTGGVNGPGRLRDLALANIDIQASGSAAVGAFVGEGRVELFNVSSSGIIISDGSSQVGGLIGAVYNQSSVTKSSSSASVTAGAKSMAGGLAGAVDGTGAPIVDCRATGTVSAGHNSKIGGLVGFTESQIDQSFATGNVRSDSVVDIGGLVGAIMGTITNSYATGAVQGGRNSSIGGLVGDATSSQIGFSYSTGQVTAPGKGSIGGFVGEFYDSTNVNDYWDIDTSGQSAPCDDACGGVTGMSDGELKSGLPFGFNAAIWAQSASVNNGYPYLIANPPQ